MDAHPHSRPPLAERTPTQASLLKSSAASDDFEPAKPLDTLAFDDGHAQRQQQPTTWYGRGYAWLMRSDNIEAHGVGPLSEEQRTDTSFVSNFTIWMTMNLTSKLCLWPASWPADLS